MRLNRTRSILLLLGLAPLLLLACGGGPFEPAARCAALGGVHVERDIGCGPVLERTARAQSALELLLPEIDYPKVFGDVVVWVHAEAAVPGPSGPHGHPVTGTYVSGTIELERCMGALVEELLHHWERKTQVPPEVSAAHLNFAPGSAWHEAAQRYELEMAQLCAPLEDD